MLMISTNYYQVKLTKNLSEHRKAFLWIALVWTIIVAFFCLVNFEELPKVDIKGFSDKLGHMVFHYGITTLWFLYYKYQKANANQKALKKAFLFSFVYGAMLEIAQLLFTNSRKADIMDVFANMTGATLAVLTLLLIIKVSKTKKSHQ